MAAAVVFLCNGHLASGIVLCTFPPFNHSAFLSRSRLPWNPEAACGCGVQKRMRSSRPPLVSFHPFGGDRADGSARIPNGAQARKYYSMLQLLQGCLGSEKKPEGIEVSSDTRNPDFLCLLCEQFRQER